MKKGRRTLALLLCALLLAGLFGCQIADRALEGAEEFLTGMEEEFSGPAENTPAPTDEADGEADGGEDQTARPDEDGSYDSKEDVALYIHIYGKLPPNYMTKAEAKELGWEGGSLEQYAPGKCIGGDRFGNYEGLLPKAEGRTYTECDIGTLGQSSRGAKRIVFSNDGLVYYTGDHYESFTLLYGEEP